MNTRVMDLSCKCFACNLIIHGLPKLFSHLHAAHALYDGPGLILQCGQGGCPQSFFSFNSFRRHLLSSHDLRTVHNDIERNQCARNINEDEDLHLEAEVFGKNPDVHVEENRATENNGDICDGESLKKRAALVITALLSQPNLTHSTIERVIHQSSSLVDSIVSNLECKTKQFVKQLGVDQNSSAYRELFAAFGEAKKPFSGLESRYQQEQYFENELGLNKPRSVVLGNRFDVLTDKETGLVKQVLVQDTFQYVSVKKTLGTVLSNPVILAEVNATSPSTDGVKRRYCDGAQFKDHPLFTVCPNALQIALFFDEYEVTNPIGAKRGIHKLGALYYTLQNIHPRLNATLPNIHLLSLFHSLDLAKYGFELILQPFMSELAELESEHGMDIGLADGTVVQKRGTLIQVPADNLGANTLGGFVESFSANYPCRTCVTSKNDMQTRFVDEQCEKRNVTNYEMHVHSALINPQSVSEHGVKKASVLNESRYFHITRGFSPDIMHDILEGVGKRECKLVLHHIVSEEKLISLDCLNDRISTFSYGFADVKNKPSVISPNTLQNQDSSLKNSASQMWCLLRILPILLGDKVPRGNQHWELFLLLRRIMDIAFAREITETMIAHLRIYIEDHHSLFRKLFPTLRLTPKHHFIVHYP